MMNHLRSAIRTAPLLLATALFVGGCNPDDDDNATPTPPGNGGGGGTLTASTANYVQGTLDGSSFSITGSGYVVTHPWESQIVVLPDPCYGQFTGLFMSMPQLLPVFSISMGSAQWYDSPEPDNAEFQALFHTGTYPYSLGAMSGVRISRYDQNLDEWATDLDSGDQTGSTFSILEKISTTDANGPRAKVKASFSCKLYKDTGDMVEVSGTCVVDFAPE